MSSNLPEVKIIKKTVYVTCPDCKKEVSKTNLSKHRKKDHHIQSEKKQIIQTFTLAIQNEDLIEEVTNLKQKVNELERENLNLKQVLMKFQGEINKCLGSYESNINFKELIGNEFANKKSLKEYLQEWGLYENWCQSNKRNPMFIQSTNDYLKQCKQTGTVIKKRSKLQCLLKLFTTDQTIKLKNIKPQFKIKPKYVMSDEEVVKYLEEQRGVDFQDYAIQYLMLYFACRIQSMIYLTWENIEYKNTHENTIEVPFIKTDKVELFPIDNDFDEVMAQYQTQYKPVPSGYVFYQDVTDYEKRKNRITQKINSRIKNSVFLTPIRIKNSAYKFSSHMLRKAEPFKEYHKSRYEALLTMRKRFRHAKNSNATFSYI